MTMRLYFLNKHTLVNVHHTHIGKRFKEELGGTLKRNHHQCVKVQSFSSQGDTVSHRLSFTAANTPTRY